MALPQTDDEWVAELTKRAENPQLLSHYSADYLSTKLQDAVALVDDSVPAGRQRVVEGQLNPRNYVRVVCDVVLRVLRNPEGLTTEGAGTLSFGRNATVASGDLWLTQNDVATLEGTRETMPGTFGVNTDLGWV